MRLKAIDATIRLWPTFQITCKAREYAIARLIHSSPPLQPPARDPSARDPPNHAFMIFGKPPPPGNPHYYVSLWPFQRSPVPQLETILYLKDASRVKLHKTVRPIAEIILCIGLLSSGSWLAIHRNDNEPKVLSTPQFTSFIIVSKENVSSTSMILTIRPKVSLDSDPYAEYWEKGLWSVEFKQPLLQIVRSYTPLPPGDKAVYGELRFLIRREPKGEMSNYLLGLPVNGEVELRGPYSEFELPEDVEDVVFLAGGTGIAPALQVVYTLLEARSVKIVRPRIHILWANRRREDVGGYPYSPKATADAITADSKSTGLLVQQIQNLQTKHPKDLLVDYIVDNEGTLIDQKLILKATRTNSRVCSSMETNKAGSKLLFVSGPDGFVSYFAGPKKWQNGKEAQGELGGILRHMEIRGWEVFKL